MRVTAVYWLFLLAIILVGLLVSADQELIDYLANNIAAEFHVLDNLVSGPFQGLIVLTNTGTLNITSLDWALYLCSQKILEPDYIWDGGAPLGNTNLTVYHLNGNLHRIEPNGDFTGFRAGQRLEIYFHASGDQVEATETLPNWYFAYPDAESRALTSTSGEELSWVGPFDTEQQWKRDPDDLYDPYTGPVRMALQDYDDLGFAPSFVIPTPVEEGFYPDGFINVGTGDWMVVVKDPSIRSEAQFLAGRCYVIVIWSSL